MRKRNYAKIIDAIPNFFAKEEDGYIKMTVGDLVEVVRPTEVVNEMSDDEIITLLVSLYRATQKIEKLIRKEEREEAIREARRDNFHLRKGGDCKCLQE